MACLPILLSFMVKCHSSETIHIIIAHGPYLCFLVCDINVELFHFLQSLGNSIGGGSLPPISKSTLPPLSRTLPALKKEPSKEEKIPVNPLDMSTLPKIPKEDQGGYIVIYKHLTAYVWY